jgi:hypothetical protein
VAQGRVEVGRMVQGGEAEHQIEPVGIIDGQQIADLVADAG